MDRGSSEKPAIVRVDERDVMFSGAGRVYRDPECAGSGRNKFEHPSGGYW